MKRIADIKPGDKYNRLTAIKEIGYKNKRDMWLFQCDCGRTTIADRYQAITGRKKSCGCYFHDLLKSGDNRRQHGMCGTRIYRIWKGIHQRCNAPITDRNYKWYAARGIKVCEEWNDFNTFYEWAVNNGYDESLTIDRIDSNGDYEPSNCRWATFKQQANNKRNNHFVTINGETHTIIEWSEIKHIPKSTIYSKLRRNIPIEQIFG